MYILVTYYYYYIYITYLVLHTMCIGYPWFLFWENWTCLVLEGSELFYMVDIVWSRWYRYLRNWNGKKQSGGIIYYRIQNIKNT